MAIIYMFVCHWFFIWVHLSGFFSGTIDSCTIIVWPATSRPHYALHCMCVHLFKISVQVSSGKYVYILMVFQCVLIWCRGYELQSLDMMCCQFREFAVACLGHVHFLSPDQQCGFTAWSSVGSSCWLQTV